MVGALYGIAALGLKAHVVVLTPLCGKLETEKYFTFLFVINTNYTISGRIQKICHPERL